MLQHYRLISQSKIIQRKKEYHMKGRVRVYSGTATWYFIMLPVNGSRRIKKDFGDIARGWGSIPVFVTIGSTSWRTSLFPDKKAGAYLLPLKADVRKRENIRSKNLVSFRLCVQNTPFDEKQLK